MDALVSLWTFLTQVRFTNWQLGAALAASAPVVWLLWRTLKPVVAHTSVHIHKIRGPALRVLLCASLLMGSWTMFALAAARPTHSTSMQVEKYEAREFVMGLDRSGSMTSWDIDAGPDMAAAVDNWEKEQYELLIELRKRYPLLYPNAPDPPVVRPPGTSANNIQRFQAGLYVGMRFLKSRPDTDRFALFTFDDRPYWVEPLGKDRDLLLFSIPEISRKGGGGTNFDGPRPGATDLGAFQTAINHLRNRSISKSRIKVILLISDGDAGISPERHEELVKQLKQPGDEVHLYSLICGPKASVKSSTTESLRKLHAAVNPEKLKEMTRQFLASRAKEGRPVRGDLVESLTDGIIWAGDGQALDDTFELLSALETSQVESDPITEDREVGHYFILAGSIALALFMGLCALYREEN